VIEGTDGFAALVIRSLAWCSGKNCRFRCKPSQVFRIRYWPWRGGSRSTQMA